MMEVSMGTRGEGGGDEGSVLAGGPGVAPSRCGAVDRPEGTPGRVGVAQKGF